jgi:hypothetical protein
LVSGVAISENPNIPPINRTIHLDQLSSLEFEQLRTGKRYPQIDIDVNADLSHRLLARLWFEDCYCFEKEIFHARSSISFKTTR